MFNMSDLSVEFQCTEKSYTFPFKDTSLDSVALNPLNILLRQNWVGKLTFKLKDFFSINKQINIISVIT